MPWTVGGEVGKKGESPWQVTSNVAARLNCWHNEEHNCNQSWNTDELPAVSSDAR